MDPSVGFRINACISVRHLAIDFFPSNAAPSAGESNAMKGIDRNNKTSPIKADIKGGDYPFIIYVLTQGARTCSDRLEGFKGSTSTQNRSFNWSKSTRADKRYVSPYGRGYDLTAI